MKTNIRSLPKNEREALGMLAFIIGTAAVFASVALPVAFAVVAAASGALLAAAAIVVLP